MSAPTRIAWTAEENNHLLACKLQGYQVSQIADSIGRPRSTVGQRIKALIGQLPEHEQWQYSTKRPIPPGHPPTLAAEHSSAMIYGWTPEMDAKAIELRGLGWSYARIGKVVGREQSRVNDRLMKLAKIGLTKREERREPKERVFAPKEGRADFFRRPAGPAPENLSPPLDPRRPGWRKCLGDNCGRVFWSPSAAVRRCEKCKKAFTRTDDHGSGSRVDDRLEMCLHL